MAKFVLVDVTSEAIMSVAKVISSAFAPLTIDDIAKALETEYKESTVKLIVTACLQLGIIQKEGEGHTITSKYRDDVRRAKKEDLIILFREPLQNYPPFLLYADFISTGYDSKESATRVRGIMQIDSSLSTVEKALRGWGISAKLIVNESGTLRIPEAEKGLPANYVKELLKALDSELNAKMFIINILSPEVYTCIDSLGIDISDLAKAIMSYEQDPKESLRKATGVFETFLHKFGSQNSVNVQGKTGVNALVNEFFDSNKILKNQQHVGNGLGGARNIASHGVDKDTSKEWNVSPQGSLSNILLVPLAMRSFYLYVKKQEQAF